MALDPLVVRVCVSEWSGVFFCVDNEETVKNSGATLALLMM